MKDFLYRTITFEAPALIEDAEGAKFPMSVSRTRNSNGHCAIIAQFGSNRVEFTNDLLNYELAARTFAKLILDAVDNGCSLPAVEKKNDPQ